MGNPNGRRSSVIGRGIQLHGAAAAQQRPTSVWTQLEDVMNVQEKQLMEWNCQQFELLLKRLSLIHI